MGLNGEWLSFKQALAIPIVSGRERSANEREVASARSSIKGTGLMSDRCAEKENLDSVHQCAGDNRDAIGE